MDKKLQDLAWSVLPKGNKVYCRNMYRTSHDGNVRDLLERLFGRHNLTSDSEEEEMLTVPRKDVVELYQEVQKTISQCKGTELAMQAIGVKNVIWSFFGSKCLPDEPNLSEILTGSEPKPAEPQKSRCERCGASTILCAHLNCQDYPPQSEPQPATERSNLDKESSIFANNRQSQCKSQNHIVDDNEMVDRIIKDSFSKERRLNIAAKMMQALVCAALIPGEAPCPPAERLAQAAFRLADALIAKSEKKGGKSVES